jgi:hypothetical protein
MNFYFSLNHLIDTTARSIQLAENLSSQAIRVSPKDGRSNRDILDQYCLLLREADGLLKRKISIGKIAIRRPVLLFQALSIAYQRVLNLAGVSFELGHGNQAEGRKTWQLLYIAQKHYRMLGALMGELTGGPVTLAAPAEMETAHQDIYTILQREFSYQQETLKLVDKAIQVFGASENVMAKLFTIRKDLTDAKWGMQQMISEHACECMAPV